ncbi:MAG: hypothetical protein KO173_05320 [Methanoregulaceae archaeon]|jgi:L-asparagine transporter-like permease|nr:hypothetical protein [Methanoregulaceae archaeon]HOO44798.1 hypothetical protein [Deltaproteobacteria bacterium]MDD3090426.1 hypothetical protein [Methanoregulaceae archaeon]MDD5048293.1 hypothetical protein [Methanoregulaceae archaeon]MDD5684513.1 hypothetical protein [Methanoregulaceae archaeon]
MDDVLVYVIIGVLMFFIGLILGYLLMKRYYHGRFLTVAKECERVDTIVPLIAEMERES